MLEEIEQELAVHGKEFVVHGKEVTPGNRIILVFVFHLHAGIARWHSYGVNFGEMENQVYVQTHATASLVGAFLPKQQVELQYYRNYAINSLPLHHLLVHELFLIVPFIAALGVFHFVGTGWVVRCMGLLLGAGQLAGDSSVRIQLTVLISFAYCNFECRPEWILLITPPTGGRTSEVKFWLVNSLFTESYAHEARFVCHMICRCILSKLTRSGGYTVRPTVEAMNLLPTEPICFPLPPAKPPDDQDKCTFHWVKIQPMILVSLYFVSRSLYPSAAPFELYDTSLPMEMISHIIFINWIFPAWDKICVVMVVDPMPSTEAWKKCGCQHLPGAYNLLLDYIFAQRISQNWEWRLYLNELRYLAYLGPADSRPASLCISTVLVDDPVRRWVIHICAIVRAGGDQCKC